MLAGLLVACAAHAQEQWSNWDIDFDEGKKPWKEIEARMPAPPKAENLLPFEAGGRSPHRFFIDAPSLSIGEDGVVRYTLVIKAAGGATNTTFEGMRCDTREQKYYAIGQVNGNWERARSPQWRFIEYQEINRHHGVLYTDYLCHARNPTKTVKEIVQLLKYGGSLNRPVYRTE